MFVSALCTSLCFLCLLRFLFTNVTAICVSISFFPVQFIVLHFQFALCHSRDFYIMLLSISFSFPFICVSVHLRLHQVVVHYVVSVVFLYLCNSLPLFVRNVDVHYHCFPFSLIFLIIAFPFFFIYSRCFPLLS